jgi:hypothetical protein
VSTQKGKRLTGKQLHARVSRRLRKYDKLEFFVCFAMFMGKVQLLEIALKSHLVDRFNCDADAVERWPLGQVLRELKDWEMRC